jgi:hypothetical protein
MPVDTTEMREWFTKRLPKEWQAAGESKVLADRDELVVICAIAEPETAEGADGDTVESARRKAVKAWREETREKRMEIAEEAQEKFGRHVSWGVAVGGDRFLFTHISVPAMTRLKITERQVLDTLVDAGVASSRSEALAWCVRYVGKREQDWLGDLKKAFESVAEVRAKGPAA